MAQEDAAWSKGGTIRPVFLILTLDLARAVVKIGLVVTKLRQIPLPPITADCSLRLGDVGVVADRAESAAACPSIDGKSWVCGVPAQGERNRFDVRLQGCCECPA